MPVWSPSIQCTGRETSPYQIGRSVTTSASGASRRVTSRRLCFFHSPITRKSLTPMQTRFFQKNTTCRYVSAPHPGLLQPTARVCGLRASGATPGGGTAAGGGPRLPPRHVRCQVGPSLVVDACLRCRCEHNSLSFKSGQLTRRWVSMHAARGRRQRRTTEE